MNERHIWGRLQRMLQIQTLRTGVCKKLSVEFSGSDHEGKGPILYTKL